MLFGMVRLQVRAGYYLMSMKSLTKIEVQGCACVCVCTRMRISEHATGKAKVF